MTEGGKGLSVGGAIITGTPKTHKSRSVPVPTFLIEQLAVPCQGKRRDQWIFGDGNNHVRSPDSRHGWYFGAIRDAQAVDPLFPRLTLHDLRHTAASLAVGAGANVKAVQRMLGGRSGLTAKQKAPSSQCLRGSWGLCYGGTGGI